MRRRRRILILAILLGVGALSALDHAGLFGYRGEDRTRYHGTLARVRAVIDGETIEVDLPDGDEATTTIHLRGVRVGRTPDSAAGSVDAGEEAARFLRENALHHRVRLALDPNRPPRNGSGHVSAYVYLKETGEMVNEALIQRGLAGADGRFEHVLRLRFVQLAAKAAMERESIAAGKGHPPRRRD